MRIETKITLILLAVALAGLGALALVHPRSETLSIDLDSGATRLDRFFYGFPYSRTAVPSFLEWVAERKGGTGENWVAMSERHTGSPLRRGVYQRRIGQVYADAYTYAPLVESDPARLRSLLRRIAAADSAAIWELRQRLRQACDARRAAHRG